MTLKTCVQTTRSLSNGLQNIFGPPSNVFFFNYGLFRECKYYHSINSLFTFIEISRRQKHSQDCCSWYIKGKTNQATVIQLEFSQSCVKTTHEVQLEFSQSCVKTTHEVQLEFSQSCVKTTRKFRKNSASLV